MGIMKNPLIIITEHVLLNITLGIGHFWILYFYFRAAEQTLGALRITLRILAPIVFFALVFACFIAGDKITTVPHNQARIGGAAISIILAFNVFYFRLRFGLFTAGRDRDNYPLYERKSLEQRADKGDQR